MGFPSLKVIWRHPIWISVCADALNLSIVRPNYKNINESPNLLGAKWKKYDPTIDCKNISSRCHSLGPTVHWAFLCSVTH